MPNLEINPKQWADSIRKIILFHALFLIFDFFFETPWGWDSEGYFFIGFNVPDLYRAHWSEKTWGVGSGPGTDIPRTDVAGWWRVVITV